jgi:hypothetical protein
MERSADWGPRAALRQEHFAQPLAELKTLPRSCWPAQSRLNQARTYLLGHWAPLTAHLQYSHTKPDTNAVQNAIRLQLAAYHLLQTPRSAVTSSAARSPVSTAPSK